MCCCMCQRIFHLDTSFPPDVDQQKGSTISHHESYSALVQAAHDGCNVCSLLVKESYSGNPEPILHPLPVERVIFQLSHDILEFIIPHRITNNHPEDDDFSSAFVYNTIALNISTKHDDPLASLFVFRPLSYDSSSERCYETASEWIQHCLKTHTECPDLPSPLPSRVIDVNGADTDPFLHISSGECKPWLVLSHCWGINQNFITTSENIEMFSLSIPLGDMPQSFKDAILITRKLGFQYIWIDSLCIIQDSKEDWEAESRQMASIYQHATATISADSSDGDYQGIFNGIVACRGEFNLHHLPCYSSERGLEGSLIISQHIGAHSDKRNPLQSRAWVLQEQALSVRNLLYEESGLSWNCQTRIASETRPSLKLCHPNTRKLHQIPFKSLPPRIDSYIGMNSMDRDATTIVWWYHTVANYAARQLTFPKDRFPAIAGVAREFAACTGYTYLAGLWVEDIHRGLIWSGHRNDSYRETISSWSWGGVGSFGHVGLYETNSLAHYIRAELAVELVNFSKTHLTSGIDDVYLGGCATTTLTLRGWCKDIQPFLADNQFYNDSHSHSSRLQLHLASFHTEFWLDRHYEIEEAAAIFIQRKMVVLIVSAFLPNPDIFSGTGMRLYALLLEPMEIGLEETYKRIAVLNIADDGRYEPEVEGFEIKTLKLA